MTSLPVEVQLNKNIVGTKLVVDNNGPGFELRIKDSEKTESIKAN
jgi:hypothetical protein